MTVDEAKKYLTNYICCCAYGTSPTRCSDSECPFGKAVRILCEEAYNENNE